MRIHISSGYDGSGIYGLVGKSYQEQEKWPANGRGPIAVERRKTEMKLDLLNPFCCATNQNFNRVTLVVALPGWVDLEMGSSPACPVGRCCGYLLLKQDGGPNILYQI